LFSTVKFWIIAVKFLVAGASATASKETCTMQMGGSVLELDSEGVYQPKTRETRAAYETLLSIVRGQFGDQPADVLRGAADEIMAVLKNDRLKVIILPS